MSSGDKEVERDPKEAQALYQALHAEADKLATAGLFAEAIDKYSKALAFHPNQLDCLVNRSRCFMMQGDISSSLLDVNKALELNPTFIRAIYQKAESLYARGDFEDALVLFHRGARARPELAGFEIGIHKSIEAIRSAVVLLDTAKLKKVLKKQAVAGKSQEMLDKSAAMARTKSKIASNNNGGSGAGAGDGSGFTGAYLTAANLQSERNLIEELQDDKLFLQELLNDSRFCQSCDGEIEHLVKEGLNYIQTRVEFWKQGNPNSAATATVKEAVMGSRLNLAQDELSALNAKRALLRKRTFAIKTGLGGGAGTITPVPPKTEHAKKTITFQK